MNGWKNYETWACYLWLTSTEATTKWLEYEARYMLGQSNGDRNKAAVDLAEDIKERVEEGAPELSGMYSDLLGYAIQQIDYYEIAKSFYE